MLCTCNATPSISPSPISLGLADPAPPLPYIGNEPLFTLSLSADGETWGQVMNDDDDYERDNNILEEVIYIL